MFKFFALLLCWMLLTACTPTISDADLQATVDASVQATNAAAQTIANTVEAAVAATTAALPPPPTATAVASIDVYTLSEEELVVLIEAAVAEAVTASEITGDSATQATADGTVSAQEVDTLTVYVNSLEQAIAYAEELIAAYEDLYGEYAEEVLALLAQVEEDLNAIAENSAGIAAILAQGSEATTAAAAQLNAAAEQAQTKAAEVQAQVSALTPKVQAQIQQREQMALQTLPTEIAANPADAIRQLYAYLDGVEAALADRKIDPAELQNLAQLGANASASLKQHGGAQLGSLSEKINALTSQLARGQWNLAQRSLPEFKRNLPARPVRP